MINENKAELAISMKIEENLTCILTTMPATINTLLESAIITNNMHALKQLTELKERYNKLNSNYLLEVRSYQKEIDLAELEILISSEASDLSALELTIMSAKCLKFASSYKLVSDIEKMIIEMYSFSELLN